MLRVGVDVDDTLCDFVDGLNNYVNLLPCCTSRYSVSDYECYTLLEDIWNVSTEVAQQRVRDFCTTEGYMSLVPYAEAQDVLSTLKSRGYFTFYAITARGEESREVTVRWLSTHYPGVFTDVVLCNTYSNNGKKKVPKAEVCDQLGVSLIIDDRPDTLGNLADRVKVIAHKKKWNDKYSGTRATWREIGEILSEDTMMKYINENIVASNFVIAVSGKIGCGKDTVCDIVTRHFPLFEKRSFSTRLKEVVATLVGTYVSHCDNRTGKSLYYGNIGCTIGQALQKVGTNMKILFGDSVWANLLLSDPELPRLCVISDCRLLVEVYKLLNVPCPCLIIRVNGDPVGIRQRNEDKRDLNHVTETELDDYPFANVISNDSTLEYLERCVLDMVVPFLFTYS